ncbi:MAG: GEVED domain-containing protein, partial [Ferruginibacter sp.]
MQNKTTFKKMSDRLKMICVVVCLALTGSLSAQTVSTASGTNYNGDYSLNNPAALLVSFSVTNTTASAVALTDVSTQMAPYFSVIAGSTSNNKLYASTTSLGGAFDVSSAAWSQVATGTATVPSALAFTSVITGANYIINPGVTVRFAIECSTGLAFSFTPTPTPNNFTTSGIILSVGNATATGGNVGYAGVSPVPAVGNTPAFFGGSITVISTVPCTGAPAPGNTLASATAVCPGVNFNLSLQNTNLGFGITYQWQDSSATTAGAWVNIAGATSSALTTSQAIATYYRAAVTCTGSATTTNSNKILVDKAPQSGCYCDAGALNGNFESISNFTLGTINNASTGTSGYENFTSLSTDLVKGANYPFNVENADGYSTDQVIIFIDYNHNGSFTDPGETVYTSANGAGPYIDTLNVPASALTGPTRLRIRLHDTSVGPNATSCGSSSYGEVEDYTVNILPCIPLTPIQPSNATVLCGNTAKFTLGGTGSFINYQW